MPIIGKIYAKPRTSMVKTMRVGEIAMIELSELAITRKCIYLDPEAEVIYLEEDETCEEFLEDIPDCVSIKRIGEGLTEEDFEIDFSKQKTNERTLLLETSTFFEIHRRGYICFTDVKICTTRKEQEQKKEKTVDDLEQELEAATESQDFIEAARLRDEIDKKNKKK
jgi:hypothetical protein